MAPNAEAALQMKERTLQFAEDIVEVCRLVPRTFEGRHVADQLFRASTSVAANYRAARRARSRRERIKLLKSPKVETVRKEADELIAIFYSTRQRQWRG